MAHLDKMRTIEGVKTAMQMSWFGGKYKDDSLAFAQFAVDAKAMMNVFDELTLPPDQLSKWQKDRGRLCRRRADRPQPWLEIGRQDRAQEGPSMPSTSS